MDNLQEIWHQAMREIDNCAQQDEYIAQIKEFLAPILEQCNDVRFDYDSFPNTNVKLQFKLLEEWYNITFLPTGDIGEIYQTPEDKKRMRAKVFYYHNINNRQGLIKALFLRKIFPNVKFEEVTMGFSDTNYSHIHYLLMPIASGCLRIYIYKSYDNGD